MFRSVNEPSVRQCAAPAPAMHTSTCWPNPPWANVLSHDRFGTWAAMEVGGVTVRLRWIPAGDTKPSAAAARPDEVTVDEGFWFGETPCMQALWTAVMGRNPSRFRSRSRPVEQVSWLDCREFLRALSERVPSLSPRLPSEAEWLHAYHAGAPAGGPVRTLRILERYNAPALDPVAWYGGNSGQGFELEEGWDSRSWRGKQYSHHLAGTRPVAQKQANPRGLYDLLGNVWEWCSDRYRSNGDEPAETALRVVCGGSWFDEARAFEVTPRFAYPGAFRSSLVGLRLAAQ